MKIEVVTRERVIELAKIMPLEKLARWYEYGLFIQSYPLVISVDEGVEEDESQLLQEFAIWEAASDEDWLQLEHSMIEVS